MAKRFRCPECGETGDMRGANSHMRQVHNMKNATADDVEVIEESNKPVREADDVADVVDKMESDELVGVADNAIVFRNEIIITDPQIKERIADKLVEAAGGTGI
jgi:hypothetical protein